MGLGMGSRWEVRTVSEIEKSLIELNKEEELNKELELKQIRKENKEMKEFNEELEDRKIAHDLDFIKARVSKLMCSVGLHAWVLVAKGKKDGKRVYMRKCRRCGIDSEKVRSVRD